MTEYVFIVINEDAEIEHVSNTEHGWHEYLINSGIKNYTTRDSGMISDHDSPDLVSRTLVKFKTPDSQFDVSELRIVECWIVR